MNFIEMCFFLWSGKHKDFMVFNNEGDISDSALKEGDLILRNINNSPFYHVGVYCGEGEVIDFAGKSDSPEQQHSGFVSCSSSYMEGTVSKVGLKIFIRGKKSCVLRLRCDIASGFRDRIRKAMNDVLSYSAATFNCLHFALNLLGYELLNQGNDETMALKKTE